MVVEHVVYLIPLCGMQMPIEHEFRDNDIKGSYQASIVRGVAARESEENPSFRVRVKTYLGIVNVIEVARVSVLNTTITCTLSSIYYIVRWGGVQT